MSNWCVGGRVVGEFIMAETLINLDNDELHPAK